MLLTANESVWHIGIPRRERESREKERAKDAVSAVWPASHNMYFDGKSLLYYLGARVRLFGYVGFESPRLSVIRCALYWMRWMCIVLAEDRLMAIDLHYANWLASESSCLFARLAYRQYRSHVHSREDSPDPTWKVPLFYDNVLHRYVEARAKKKIKKKNVSLSLFCSDDAVRTMSNTWDGIVLRLMESAFDNATAIELI